jgi:putative DNA primase/helicase
MVENNTSDPIRQEVSLNMSDYVLLDEKGKKKLNLELLVMDLLHEFNFSTLLDTDEILIYHDGCWHLGGEAFIKSECQKRVGLDELLTEHKINEILGHIRRTTYTDRKTFNTERFIINLKNGLFDVRTRELKPHTPEFLSTMRVPLIYDPRAGCPRVRQFFEEVLELQDIPLIEELFGYILIPDYSIQRAFLFVGDGANGKSTMLELMKAFIGKDNTANIPWHALELNRFASANLEGKLVNLFADLPPKSLSFTTTFKLLTGGDSVPGEKKFRDIFSFVNFARLVFSTNKPPQIYDDDSYAFWRRWVIVHFPSKFLEDDPRTDSQILQKLSTEGELSGLLNLALDGLGRLLTSHRYSYTKSVEETTDTYLRRADPVYSFISDNCEPDPEAETPKAELYDSFKNYCLEQKIPLLKPNSFARALQNQIYIRVASSRPEINGTRVTCWKGIRLISVRDVKDSRVSGFNKPRKLVNNNIERYKSKTLESLPSLTEERHSLIEFWKSKGAPLIHLRQGENCEDLKKLLSSRNLLPEHFEAVKNWAVERGWAPPDKEIEIPEWLK